MLQIGADSVELLSHLCNLFIMFVKYYIIHDKGITLCINRFSRYVELRLHSISSLRIIAINPSAWGHLNPRSYCDVGRLFYGLFKLWSKLQRKK